MVGPPSHGVDCFTASNAFEGALLWPKVILPKVLTFGRIAETAQRIAPIQSDDWFGGYRAIASAKAADTAGTSGLLDVGGALGGRVVVGQRIRAPRSGWSRR